MEGGNHTGIIMWPLHSKDRLLSCGWRVCGEEAVSECVLQDGLDFSRQKLNGWKRSCLIRYRVNKTNNMKTRRCEVSPGTDLVGLG